MSHDRIRFSELPLGSKLFVRLVLPLFVLASMFVSGVFVYVLHKPNASFEKIFCPLGLVAYYIVASTALQFLFARCNSGVLRGFQKAKDGEAS